MGFKRELDAIGDKRAGDKDSLTSARFHPAMDEGCFVMIDKARCLGFGLGLAVCVASGAISLLLCGSRVAAAQTPTYKCHKPASAVARTICASSEYIAMDREIAALTDRAKAELTPGEQSQLTASIARYLRQRNGCEWAAHNSAHPGTAIDECIRSSLEERVRRLRGVVASSGT